jgi:hypothetical protein
VLLGNKFYLVWNQPRMWIMPKADAASVKLSVSSSVPGECVLVRLYDPEGKEVLSKNTRETNPVRIDIPIAPAQKGKPWSLSLTEANEDLTVSLGDGLLPMAAARPQDLLQPKQ